MLLITVKVENYLSIKGECEFPADSKVTVLLGANDHGKSNLLRTLEHLNFDRPLTAEDQNWDSDGVKLTFSFLLNDSEVRAIQGVLEELKEELSSALVEQGRRHLEKLESRENGDIELSFGDDTTNIIPETAPITPTPVIPVPTPITSSTSAMPAPAINSINQAVVGTTATATVQNIASPSLKPAVSSATVVPDDDLIAESTELEAAAPRVIDEIQDDIDFVQTILDKSPCIQLVRDGVGSALTLSGKRVDTLSDFGLTIAEIIPRVELFKAFSGELQDSITASEIGLDTSEFLQGIFFYAGLNPMDCQALFDQNDETDKTLEEASKTLDKALRQRWAQGVDLNLEFQLKHRNSSIELLVKDPAVKKRHARMSKRSSGVTQFFRLSMALHARRRKNPANSYIYVFDEPGVFLHPKGQKDLLSVFEELAQNTQVVFATHSLFMLNQNHPERHRLITKSNDTTLVDSKPYRANWKYAVDALGVKLTANILFSPNILLVEGDSDPIYLYEMLRVLNNRLEIDIDANLLGIMSYGDLTNLRFLLQTFKSESNERLVAVLFEGDAQGKTYQKQIKPLCEVHGVTGITLDAGSAIEDYCLYPDLFLEAVEETVRGSFAAMQKEAPKELKSEIAASWKSFIASRAQKTSSKSKKLADSLREDAEIHSKSAAENVDEAPDNAGGWFKQFSNQLSINGSSKIALARNYVFLSREADNDHSYDQKRLTASKRIADEITAVLKLPSSRAKQQIEV